MIEIEWVRCERPTQPGGLLAREEHKVDCLRSLLQLQPDRQTALLGVAAASCIVILGREQDLPWIPGVIYLGRAASSPHLWWPTYLQPTTPPDLLQHAVHRHAGSGDFAIDPERQTLIPLREALPLDPHTIQDILKRHAA
ncbi:hypothetical protein HCH_02784 [Hahella chejuensis KCTC 2396]|uniref:MoxR-vWA-beta-propeller ternary system domain-containing protein n=1 Tax=Hahella chejuensis (strain KCTC 2396) TaxID=349521 RepID=Q2SIG0_HAHCH|nr:hypothetical protein [Hahella chejuensis]ABC29564.1 hypothetical protein HCH_02784 [Hahella chejuensis KCTC 2396]